MHRLVITVVMTIAFVCGGLFAWHAEAMPTVGAAQIRATADSIATTAKPAACRGWGARCPPGYVWNGARCVPC